MSNEKSVSYSAVILEKFAENGCNIDCLNGSEIMCMVLSSVLSRGKDTKALAEKLTGMFGSAGALLKASPAVLIGTGLLSPTEIIKLKVINAVFILTEIQKLGKTIRADDERAIHRYLKLLYHGCGEEIVYLIPLKGGKLSSPIRLATGLETRVVFDPSILIELLELSPSCKEFILCHNHPNDLSTPSERDIGTTEKIFGIAKLKGFTLKKHYVVGTDGVSEVPFDDNILRSVFKV